MKLRNVLEDVSSRLQSRDHDVDTIITELKAVSKMASELVAYLQENNPQQMEGWVQTSITEAADKIEAIHKNTIYLGDHFEE